jgi:hypothetical protein
VLHFVWKEQELQRGAGARVSRTRRNGGDARAEGAAAAVVREAARTQWGVWVARSIVAQEERLPLDDKVERRESRVRRRLRQRNCSAQLALSHETERSDRVADYDHLHRPPLKSHRLTLINFFLFFFFLFSFLFLFSLLLYMSIALLFR